MGPRATAHLDGFVVEHDDLAPPRNPRCRHGRCQLGSSAGPGPERGHGRRPDREPGLQSHPPEGLVRVDLELGEADPMASRPRLSRQRTRLGQDGGDPAVRRAVDDTRQPRSGRLHPPTSVRHRGCRRGPRANLWAERRPGRCPSAGSTSTTPSCTGRRLEHTSDPDHGSRRQQPALGWVWQSDGDDEETRQDHGAWGWDVARSQPRRL